MELLARFEEIEGFVKMGVQGHYPQFEQLLKRAPYPKTTSPLTKNEKRKSIELLQKLFSLKENYKKIEYLDSITAADQQLILQSFFLLVEGEHLKLNKDLQ